MTERRMLLVIIAALAQGLGLDLSHPDAPTRLARLALQVDVGVDLDPDAVTAIGREIAALVMVLAER